jgi:hypothetical protein
MPIDYVTIRLGEDGYRESELANASPNSIDSLVVLAWIAFVGFQSFDAQYSMRSLPMAEEDAGVSADGGLRLMGPRGGISSARL